MSSDIRKLIILFTIPCFLLTCRENEITLDLSHVVISSQVNELDNGAFEFDVFEVERMRVRTINTLDNPLRDYSFGIMTLTDVGGTPTAVGLANLTSDLIFVDLRNYEYSEVTSLPDTLVNTETIIPISEGSLIGIIGKSKKMKMKVISATSRLLPDDTPQSEIAFMAEYLE